MTSTYGAGPTMQAHITGMVQRGTGAGGIILSHDRGKPQTVATYRSLLPWLKARFSLVALPTSGPDYGHPASGEWVGCNAGAEDSVNGYQSPQQRRRVPCHGGSERNAAAGTAP